MPADHSGRLSKHNSKDVDELRLQGYSTAREFTLLRPDLIIWGEHDDEAAVIGSWCGDVLASTLRGFVAADRVTAEDFLCCEVAASAELFPSLLLGRGATEPSFRRSGLNALLRYYFLHAAAAPAPTKPVSYVNSSIVMPYVGAPRLQLLRDLGYEMQVPARVWDPEVNDDAQPLIGVLPSTRFDSAISMLANLTAAARQRFPWRGAQLKLPEVQCLVPHSRS